MEGMIINNSLMTSAVYVGFVKFLSCICSGVQSILATMQENWKNRSSGFPTRSDTSQPLQPQKMARSLKFMI